MKPSDTVRIRLTITVLYFNQSDCDNFNTIERLNSYDNQYKPGYYWSYDSEWFGPFNSAEQAIANAKELLSY